MIDIHAEPQQIQEQLLRHGLIFQSPDPQGLIADGIQIDLNAVNLTHGDGTMSEASFCDHDCTTAAGNYDCPAALSRNKGAKAKFASGEKLLEWILKTREGIIEANQVFVNNGFEQYCRNMLIPPTVAAVLRATLLSKVIEVNLFGGNPELHPEVLWLIAQLREQGFRVNLTTTGKKIMLDAKFRDGLAQEGPHLIALSADDVDPENMHQILNLDPAGILAQWKQIPKYHGQAQKFLESLWTLRYAISQYEQGKQFPPILFNMVLHKGNIRRAREIMNALQALSPKVMINPYPAQVSFERGIPPFDSDDLEAYGKLIDYLIAEATKGNPQFTRRLHYWLVQKAILQLHANNPTQAARMVAGHDTWHCARNNIDSVVDKPGYVQIGRNTELVQIGGTEITEPGGHLGCFWFANDITDFWQIESARQVTNWLLAGRKLAHETHGEDCGGCVMPRLMFDITETEFKLLQSLVGTYLQIRQEYIGF